MTNSSQKVAIIHSAAYEKVCCLSPKFENRYQMVLDLIKAYNLLDKMDKLSVDLSINPLHLTGFHSSDYLEALIHLEQFTENNEDLNEDMESFGFGYDCPAFEGVVSYATAAVAGTLTAAQALVDGRYKIAINWGGGWHHAKRSEAAGFCYLNDIVFGILKLRETFSRVLYVDLDLHHGDGVEESFSGTASVLTLSFHHFSCGFFPGSGRQEDLGVAKGRYATFNIPLEEGMDDSAYIKAFTKLAPHVLASFKPDVLVIQCGADALASDPHRCFNLTLHSYTACVAQLLAWNLPTLLLGGGGYNFPDTAKLWTTLTALAICASGGDLASFDVPNQDDNYSDFESTIQNVAAGATNVAGAVSSEQYSYRSTDNVTETINDFQCLSRDTTNARLLQLLISMKSDVELSLLLPSDIPEHQFWRHYGPDFDLSVTPSLRPNRNTGESVEKKLLISVDQLAMYGHLNCK